MRSAVFGTELVCELCCSGIAELASRILDVSIALLCKRCYVSMLHMAGDAEALGKPPYELLVLFRIDATKPMVHMEDDQALPCDMGQAPAIADIELRGGCQNEQGRRISAARDHQDDRSSSL